MTPIEELSPINELALRLHVGAQAIREGRAEATIADLVEGAMESIRAEALALRGGGARAEMARTWRNSGLCTLCGRANPAPGYHICPRCLSSLRASMARRSVAHGGASGVESVC